MGFTSVCLPEASGSTMMCSERFTMISGGFRFAYALVVQDAVLRPQHPQLTGAEGLAAVAQLRQLCQHRLQALFVAVPAEEGTVEGVAVALHPDLITVVQAGHAGAACR